MALRARSSLLLATLAAALLLLRPAPAAACKPPQFIGERLSFSLEAARRGGQPLALDRLPRELEVLATPYDHMLVRDLGYLKLVTATHPLPPQIERYNRRQRRIGTPICWMNLVYREPATPGRYNYELDPTQTHPPDDPQWLELWPLDVPGIVELGPTRDRLTVHIDRPGDPIALEYRLTRATFSRCAVTGDRSPGLLALFALAVRRRRRR